MKTTTKNTNTMKKSILIAIVALLMLPLSGMAQNVFDKYSDNENVTFVSIKPKMFQMLAKMDINTDDPEAQEYINMVNSITSFKTMATDNKTISTDIANWVKSRSASLEELMVVKDDGVNMTFYVKQGKDADHVSELLMFINGLDAVTKDSNIEINGKKRTLETVVISLTGDIDLNQISKLANKMDLPGGKELEKKSKK
ncbi:MULTISPECIES: DUF4252 domain-containing protein [Mesoflavibacter]|uniref:DUF4252 domain-containing protein n=2 Tax=Mesoflavibacter profundi TaxID=2708110 RepID=A0ABT4RYS0_9FLAO|nr:MULTISPECIES: DUF4252 domain-containing protein [Mesoflavibacter]MDA0176970.1 DUF4252 domain-containing protein [Mesoflavibacter profundi]QIJ87885.1 hypothetical protein C7H62_0075 [Mesoflavibacter sp. HG96]QIJ90613.1 hypothetical protein C7H56_0075 [Mesoflavibacter sp. HG37]